MVHHWRCHNTVALLWLVGVRLQAGSRIEAIIGVQEARIRHGMLHDGPGEILIVLLGLLLLLLHLLSNHVDRVVWYLLLVYHVHGVMWHLLLLLL